MEININNNTKCSWRKKRFLYIYYDPTIVAIFIFLISAHNHPLLLQFQELDQTACIPVTPELSINKVIGLQNHHNLLFQLKLLWIHLHNTPWKLNILCQIACLSSRISHNRIIFTAAGDQFHFSNKLLALGSPSFCLHFFLDYFPTTGCLEREILHIVSCCLFSLLQAGGSKGALFYYYHIWYLSLSYIFK